MINKKEIIETSLNSLLEVIVDIDKKIFIEKTTIILNKYIDEITKEIRDELTINLLGSEFSSLFSSCTTVEIRRMEMQSVITKETLTSIQKKCR